MGSSHSLNDKYTAESGAVFMSGTQALVRLPIIQMRRDKLAGLDTATYISGYRGSPMGIYDQQLQKASEWLAPHRIRFVPGVNEDLAATAIWGTQQVPLYDSAAVQGVLGIWYGKGPGVDRSGDVFRHGNAAGSSAQGGVLCIAGDDHSAKSSTVQHQSDHSFASARMPMLYPSSVHEFVEVGLLGIALSRYSGCWVGMKVISDTVETSAVVDLSRELTPIHLPDDFDMPEDGLNLRWPDPFAPQDVRLHEFKHKAVHAFARANGIDQWIIKSPLRPSMQNALSQQSASNQSAVDQSNLDQSNLDQSNLDQSNLDQSRSEQTTRDQSTLEQSNLKQSFSDKSTLTGFGIISSGKAFEDARQALHMLGIDEAVSASIGLQLYKVRMPYPLEPEGVVAFANGLTEVLVLEERREIIEDQLKTILYHRYQGTRIVGKHDEHGNDFLPTAATLSVAVCMRAIADRLIKFGVEDSLQTQIQQRVANLNSTLQKQLMHKVPSERKPWFCSGCPHNTSTRVPEGSKALAGIGCHYMVQWMDRDTDTFTHMGAEGVPWTSISHYVDDKHRFVNIGDGTYFHSGLLAIRASVASGVNLTYKVLYNDAVAMTGGQSLDGALTPAQITHQLKAEGVWPVYLVSDEPELYPASIVADGVVVKHRDYLDPVMRELRDLRGCNAIVYVQTCAAEKRRRRKRGLLVDPDQRMFINADVCEGCGDCSTQSNCVSVEPLETAFGRKRRINQSSCNKDYSCANGFCPSFVTVSGASLKRRKAQQQEKSQTLPEPSLPVLASESWNVLITGIGGTGVLTIGSILGMAAHIDGHAAMILDMTGLAQKGGAVLSHVRIAAHPDLVTSAHIVPAGCDLLFAADAVVAASKSTAELLNEKRTNAVVNTATAPVADFVLHRDMDFGHDGVASAIKKQVRDVEHFHAFSSIAEKLTGDAMSTNIMMLGYSWQQGLLPVSLDALEQAITLNGVAVEANLTALEWGRQLAAQPDAVKSKLVDDTKKADNLPLSLDALIEHRIAHLTNYQGPKLADKYLRAVNQFQDRVLGDGLDLSLVKTLAHNYSRVLSYKDEYEVSRLYSLPSFKAQLTNQFDGDYALEFNLAPAILGGRAPNGRPKKRKMGPWVLKLFNVLQHGKKLRGTPFDLFGYTTERRAERQWIKRYEQDMQRILVELTPANASIAEQLLGIPDQIRGFGPVKAEAMQAASSQREQLWRDFDAPKPIDLTSAA